jgi:uncharacterized phiE125 gp8 family phage protein
MGPSVRAARIAGPRSEPVTVEWLKKKARIDRTDEDDLLAGYIAAAREQFERDTDLTLGTQTWSAQITNFAGGALVLPHGPLQAIVAVVGRDAHGVETGIAPTQYQFAVGPPARIYLPPAWSTYAIVYETGMVVTPLIEQAIGLLAAHFATQGRDAVTAETTTLMPFGYTEAMARFRVIAEP